jgi:hypothetical protein
MLDVVSWKVFEKTGNIDAYMLYVDIKLRNMVEKMEYRRNEEDKSSDSR